MPWHQLTDWAAHDFLEKPRFLSGFGFGQMLLLFDVLAFSLFQWQEDESLKQDFNHPPTLAQTFELPLHDTDLIAEESPLCFIIKYHHNYQLPENGRI